jgi:branched-chain amino acid transport system ATP-binding protein
MTLMHATKLPTNAGSMLTVSNLRCNYGSVIALKDISLTVNHGEIVSIIGANGAGKTSLLHCLAGTHTPSSGSIFFRENEITRTNAPERVASGIALVPEGRQIFPKLTVKENLELGAYLRNDTAEIEHDLKRAYDLFPILHERNKQLGGTLSGGEQQMLAIARALLGNPSLLLMDEPSMGVAPILVAKIFQAIKELNHRGITIVLVEQNARSALRLAHRAYVIETGEIVLEGNASDLLKDPRVEDAYLGG